MAYISSENIKVFPSTRRSDYRVNSRLMTEAAMVRIINQLINSDGFIITPRTSTASGYDETKPFEFNIKGYYFKVNSASLLTANQPAGSDIYAHIIIDITSSEYEELFGQDEGTEYKGLYIDNSETYTPEAPYNDTTRYSVYTLKLFNHNSDNTGWVVADESRMKFDDFSSDIDIDGGIVG